MYGPVMTSLYNFRERQEKGFGWRNCFCIVNFNVGLHFSTCVSPRFDQWNGILLTFIHL